MLYFEPQAAFRSRQLLLTWNALSFTGVRRERVLERGQERENERLMAAEEEKPGLKSRSSIVPCFLFVEVRCQVFLFLIG